MENCQGLTTAFFLKDPTDAQWQQSPDMTAWRVWMAEHLPAANLADSQYVQAYMTATLLVETLRKCGDDLTRENIMRQATSFNNLQLPLLLPGISVNTSSTNYQPIQSLQLAQFKGEAWELVGPVINGTAGRG